MKALQVLVAAESDQALKRYGNILRNCGCEVVEVSSIQGVFEHLETPYEVVFVDYKLKDGTASDLIGHLEILEPKFKNVVCLTDNFRIEGAELFKKLIDRSSEDRELKRDIRVALDLFSPTYVGRRCR